MLVLSAGWKELPTFISTSGPLLFSDETTVKKIHSNCDLKIILVYGNGCVTISPIPGDVLGLGWWATLGLRLKESALLS